MRIYVAGKWEEKERIRVVMEQLRKAGHEITYDWTVAELNGVPEANQAVNDKVGVLTADAYVGVFEKNLPYKGSFVEFGLAAAAGIPIHILGSAADNCIFIKLPEVVRGIDTLLKGEAASV